jgi:hypothetical protein
MRAFLSIFALILLASCGGQLVADPASSAFESNYPTAEFTACGETHHGLGVCLIKNGEPLNKIQLKIQGYFEGSIKVTSPDCDITSPQTQRYSNSGKVEIKFDGEMVSSCIVEFVVLPEYPDEEDDRIETFNLKGILYIKEDKGTTITDSLKVKQGFDKTLNLNIGGGDGQARLAFFGCDSSRNIIADVRAGRISIKLSQITSSQNQRSCVINGGIRFNSKRIRVTYLVSFYSDLFNPLSTCSLDTSKRKVKVLCPPEVSVVSINDKFKVNRKGTFKYKRKRYNIFRAITVKGRSVLAVWKPNEGSWLWKQ